MIDEFIKVFDAKRKEIKDTFCEKHPDSYLDIVRTVIKALYRGYGSPDPERIHVIDDGHYQGTLLFVIAANGYQPYNYWYVKVNYGSCSGCDTFEAIRTHSNNLPTEDQVSGYMQLALHVVQGLKEI